MNKNFKLRAQSVGGVKSSNEKLSRIILLIFTCMTLLLSCLFSFTNSNRLDSSAYSSIPAGTVANIYNKTEGRFNRTNLDALAVKAGYSDFSKMVEAAENSATALKTGSNFGTTTVNFGSYATKQGGTADLTWIPLYLARDDDGNAILMLWLAKNESSNTSSNQEVSTWSDGTSSGTNNTSNTGNNTNPPANNYDTSYMRAVTLNMGGRYATAFSGSRAPTMVTATPTTTNKFADFTVGDLRQFLTVPNKVAAQRTRAIEKNDLGYVKGYYTANWGNDSIWLPSRFEIITNGNLFGATQTQRANSTITWLRGGGGSHYQMPTFVPANGATATTMWANCSISYGVRPAMYLNLSKIAEEEFMDVPEVTGTYMYNRSAQTIALNSDFQSDKMEVTKVERDGGTLHVAPTWTSNSISVTDAGTYTVTITAKDYVKNSQNLTYQWLTGDVGNKDRTITFTVAKAQLTEPSFGIGTNDTQDYSGSALTFNALNYPSSATSSTPAYPIDPLSADITRGEGAPVFTPVPTPQANGTLNIEVRDAGSYTAKFKIEDDENYEWSGGGTADKSVPFTVKQKQLTVTHSTNEPSGTYGWAADKESYWLEFIISGVFNGDGTYGADAVNLAVKLTKEGDGSVSMPVTAVKQADGTYAAKIDKDTFGGSFAAGSYPITLEFGGGANDGNYSLDNANSGLNGLKLKIEASEAGLANYDWRISKDGTPIAMPSDRHVPYETNPTTGAAAEYQITVDETNFASGFIAVDKSRTAEGFVDGYKNREASAAGTYTTTVALKVTDNDHAFPGGKKTGEITLTWTIDKGTIDVNGVQWQYTDTAGNTKPYAQWNASSGAWEYSDGAGGFTATDNGVPWTGQNYTLTLTKLPAAVSVNSSAYTGNKEKRIGSQSANVTGYVYDSVNYDAITLPALSWEITKVKIIIDSSSWRFDTSGGSMFVVPHLNSPYDGTGIVYEYYDMGTDSSNFPAIGTLTPLANGLSDVQNVDGTVHYYCVKAVAASGNSTDGVTAWSDVLEFVRDDTNPTHGDFTAGFQTGNNRTPVSVTLSGNPAIYDGEAHGLKGKDVVVKVGTADFDASKYRLVYYEYDDGATDKKGAPLGDGNYPVNAGDYLIEVELQNGADSDYYLTVTAMKFTIEPYRFDMSNVRWGWTDGEGVEHVYNPSTPLEYGLKADGTAIEYTLELVNLPRGDANASDAEEVLLAKMFTESGLAGLFTYTNNTSSTVTADGTTNQAHYTFNAAGLSANFAVSSMPDAITLPETQNWRIESRKIIAPKDDNSQTFDGNAHNLLELAGLNPEDKGVYYNVSGFGYANEDNEFVDLLASGGDAESVKNAQKYLITVTLIDTTNVKWLANGIVKQTPQSFTVTINKLVVTVQAWDDVGGKNEDPWVPTYDKTVLSGVIENQISKGSDGKGEVIPNGEWENGYWLETLSQRLVPTAGNEGNVEIRYADGVEDYKTFTRPKQPGTLDPIGIDRPVLSEAEKERTYTGEAQDFTPAGLKELVEKGRVELFAVDEEGNETPVGLEYFQQTNAGSYNAVARIKGNFMWKDTNSKEDLPLSFEVKKAEITPEWTVDEKTGKPLASVEGFEDIFEYHYYDENGEEIAEKDLQAGKEYAVSVTVKEEYAQNFELKDSEGNLAGEEGVYSTDRYKVPQNGFMGFVTKKLFGLPMWLWLLILLILLLLIILIIIAIVKKAKKRKAEKTVILEKERAEAEKEEEKRRREEEREEEKRRKEEEREEEKRRREEEREEEKRRREEEREEEKRRREEEEERKREEERRRREEEERKRREEDERRRREEEDRRRREEDDRRREEEERRRREDEERRRRNELAAAGLNAMNGMSANGMNGMNNIGSSPMQQPMQQPVQQPMQQPMPMMPQMPMQQPQVQQVAVPVAMPSAASPNPASSPAPQSTPIVQTVEVPRGGDDKSAERLKEYEERLRAMERELEQRRLESARREESERVRKEYEEREAQLRREIEEQKLKELREKEAQRAEERRRQEEAYRERYASEENQRRQEEAETQRLRELEEQLRQREEEYRRLEEEKRESQRLEEQFRSRYAPYPQDATRYGPMPPQSTSVFPNPPYAEPSGPMPAPYATPSPYQPAPPPQYNQPYQPVYQQPQAPQQPQVIVVQQPSQPQPAPTQPQQPIVIFTKGNR